MKIEKNKIVFGSVLALVVIFIVAYSMLVLGGDEEKSPQLKQTLVPELQQEQEDFKSRLDAVNALKEVRETTTPSIYDEKYLDSMGYYDPELPERQKEEILDSIYGVTGSHYSEYDFQNDFEEEEIYYSEESEVEQQETLSPAISAKEMELEHQLFYASNPGVNDNYFLAGNTEDEILVEVDGDQVVQAGYRLRMRLSEEATINNIKIPANTPLYGFIRFQPNRALIEIENIAHHPVKLNAYDLQDGSEGIYVENNIKADAKKEVIDNIIQDINVAGIPQIGGIKQLFQRNNRNVKVQVTNKYKLILKSVRQ